MGNIKSNGNLKWNKDSKICCKHNDVFDGYSLLHFLFGVLSTNLIVYLNLKKCKISNKKLTIISVLLILLHGILDYFENVEINGTVYSFELLFGKIFNTSALYSDSDTLQNFIGDNISFILGTLSIVLLYKNKGVVFNKKGMGLLVFVYFVIFLLISI